MLRTEASHTFFWRIRTLLVYTTLMTFPGSAIAGGGDGLGLLKSKLSQSAVSKARATMVGYYTSVGYGIVAAQYGYPELNIGPATDRSHKVSAYLWGQQVGDPRTAAEIRVLGEAAQFAFYGTIQVSASLINLASPVDIETKYRPISIDGPGGLRDSVSDIKLSVQGAEDAQTGIFELPN